MNPDAKPDVAAQPDGFAVTDVVGVRGVECSRCHTWAVAWRKYRGDCECVLTVAAKDGPIQMPDGTSFHGLAIS